MPNTERLMTAAPALAMAAALFTVAIILFGYCLRERRTEARAAEQQARPHSAHVGTAAQDAAAILRDALDERQHARAERLAEALDDEDGTPVPAETRGAD